MATASELNSMLNDLIITFEGANITESKHVVIIPESIRYLQIKIMTQTTKDIVIGFIRMINDSYSDQNDVSLYIIPQLIIHWCLLYSHDPLKQINDKIKWIGVGSEGIPRYVRLIMSDKPAMQYEAARKFRQILSIPSKPPLKEVIASGVIPRFIQLCKNYKYPYIQYELLWALSNIASGPAECSFYVMCNDAHNVSIEILQSCALYEIKAQAMWLLGNIAADFKEVKNLLMENGILNNILLIAQSHFDESYVTNFNEWHYIDNMPIIPFLSLLDTTSWTLSNLCRDSPPSSEQDLELIIQSVKHILDKCTDFMNDDYIFGEKGLEILDDIIITLGWTASYMTDYDEPENEPKYTISRMFDLGLMKQFVEFMDHDDWAIRRPYQRVIGDILIGEDHVHNCLKLEILQKYYHVLTTYDEHEDKDKERRKIFWAISNITAGPIEDVLMVEKHGLFRILCKFLKNTRFKVGKEALWAIANVVNDHSRSSTLENIVDKLVYEHGLISSLCSFLQHEVPRNKTKILLVAFECIKNILIFGSQIHCENKYLQQFKEDGMIRCLDNLRFDEIMEEKEYEKALKIYERIFYEAYKNANRQNV